MQAFHLSGGTGGYLIPARDGTNPLNRCNDFRTNLDEPEGAQGRSPNIKIAEVWCGSAASLNFHLLCPHSWFLSDTGATAV